MRFPPTPSGSNLKIAICEQSRWRRRCWQRSKTASPILKDKKIRDHRRITAQHQKALSGRTDVAVNTEKANTSSDQTADVVKEELSGVGVTLTTEQQATAEKVQHQYRLPLRSLNREIHGLHERLLALEADKLVAIENVLTKDQLSQLRTNRQTVATATTVSVNKADSSKSE